MTHPRIALRPDNPDLDPLDHRTRLDDIAVHDVRLFRAEDMGGWWWVCCYLGDDVEPRLVFHVDARSWHVIEHPDPADVTYEHIEKRGDR
jgi:hypothetical protein